LHLPLSVSTGKTGAAVA